MDSTNSSSLNDADMDGNQGKPLSDGQERVLYLLTTVSGILSIVGSFLILKIVQNSKKKKRCLSVYDRLLVGLSIADLLASYYWIFGPFTMPKGDRVWAFGNDTTCSIAGFSGLTIAVSLLYSGMISLYYALLVRHGFRDEQLAGKKEICMHLVCIILPLIGNIVFLANGVFSPRRIGLSCYLADYPIGCVRLEKGSELEDGQVECKGWLAASLTSGISAFVAVAVIVICNLIIFCHVRGSIQQYQKKAFARWENATGFFESPTEQPSSQTDKKDKSSLKLAKKLFRFGGSEKASASSQKLTREMSGRDNQMQQVRSVMNQSLFYVGSIAVVNIPILMNLIIGGVPSISRQTESDVFVFLCFATCMSPLQGVFNLLIFCRPTYLRVRRNFPNDSRLQCFMKTLEAGTSDSRGGQRRRAAPQLRPHPLPKISFIERCSKLKNKIRRSICDYFGANNNEQDTNDSNCEAVRSSDRLGLSGDCMGEDDSVERLDGKDDIIEGGIDTIQLRMKEDSSSSAFNSDIDAGVGEERNVVPSAPDVDAPYGGPLQDWHHIEFESSCVAFFSSTTSTVEA